MRTGMVWAALVTVAAVALCGCCTTGGKVAPTADQPAIKALPKTLAAQGLVLYWTGQWPLDNGESIIQFDRHTGRLYALTNRNRIMAMDSRTGVFLWDADLEHLGFSVTHVGQVDDKAMAVVAVSDRLYGFDLVTGKRVLTRLLERSPSTRLVCRGEFVYFGTNEGWLQAVNVTDPGQDWSRWTEAAIAAAPAADGRRTYLANTAGDLVATSFKNRNVLWTYPPGTRLGGVVGDLSISTGGLGLVLVPSRDYSLYAMNPSSGRPAWICTTGNPLTKAAHSSRDQIYFTTDTHILFCTKEAGGEKPLWTVNNINDFVAASPAAVYVRSMAGALQAFDPATGAFKFNVTTAGLNLIVTNDLDGQIFAADEVGHIICLREAKGQYDLKPGEQNEEAQPLKLKPAAAKPAPAAADAKP